MVRMGAAVCAAGLLAPGAQALPSSPPTLQAAQGRAGEGMPRPERYAYGSAAFTSVIADSYRGHAGSSARFYAWLESAYDHSGLRFPGIEARGLRDLLAREEADLAAIANPVRRAEEEIRVAQRLRHVVRKVIPRFSLDRGFEFRNVVLYGERQCLLQSVLIAGLLQAAGADAGVAMVYRNTRGDLSNNGHAVTLLKLSDGCDLIVDASERDAFPRHQGLFLRCPGYRYVQPVYRQGSSRIRAYRPVSGAGTVTPSAARPLDLPFVRSQFYYYRGERVPGGILSPAPTPAGLRLAEGHLRMSVRLCPANPLAVYMLGRALRARGRAAEAARLLQQAHTLYARAGWIPEGPVMHLIRAKAAAGQPGR